MYDGLPRSIESSDTFPGDPPAANSLVCNSAAQGGGNREHRARSSFWYVFPSSKPAALTRGFQLTDVPDVRL